MSKNLWTKNAPPTNWITSILVQMLTRQFLIYAEIMIYKAGQFSLDKTPLSKCVLTLNSGKLLVSFVPTRRKFGQLT